MIGCNLCDPCPINEPGNDVYYEIHITVENDPKFEEFCNVWNAKPIVIAFDNDAPKQVMLSKIFKNRSYESVKDVGDFMMVCAHLAGLKPLRLKIETSLNNTAIENVLYYEAHFSCLPFTETEKIRNEIEYWELHKSRNLLKKGEQKFQMLTMRMETRTTEKFFNFCEFIRFYLEEAGIVVDKIIKEMVVYDSNLELDNQWLAKDQSNG